MKRALVLLAACGSAKSAPPAMTFPPDTRFVAHFPGATEPILQYLIALDGTPPCVATLAKRVTEGWRVLRGPDDRNGIVAIGDLSRDDVEACALAVGARIGRTWEVHRDGALSEIAGQWVGFGDHRIVWDPDRARVEQLLAPAAGDAPVTPLLPRLDPKAMSFVGSVDFTSRAFGVATRGEVLVAEKPPTIHLLCASADDASRLRAGFDAVASRADVPPEVAKLLRSLVPRVDGSEVAIDISDVFSSPDTPALVAWLTAQIKP